MSQKKVRARNLRHLSHADAKELAGPGGLTNTQGGVILAIGLIFCLVVVSRWTLNDSLPTHWTPWRDLSVVKTAAILLAPFLAVGWVLWMIDGGTSASKPLLLGLLAVCNIALQALGLLADPRGLRLVPRIAASAGATSYFSDAARIQGLTEWLRHFHEIGLGFHSQTHPAGPILFYYFFIKLFGPAAGALIGGWAVGLLGSFGVVVMYWFAGLWTPDPRIRLTAAAFYAVIPALTLFFPEFDQFYPVLSMVLMLFWVKALDSSRTFPREAVLGGAVLFVATLFAYNLLAALPFLAYYGIYWLWREKGTQPAWNTLLRTAGIVLGTAAGLYVALWVTTGYNPVAAFRHATAIQAILAARLRRAYAPFAVLDIYDLFLGAGIIALPILWFHLRRTFKRFDAGRAGMALTLIGLATILTVDLSGLLRGETARVWLFLQPLLVAPVAVELYHAPRRWKVSILALQWLILACLKAKMTFLEP